jgi:2,4'-dihydroxyacetophenone dioxygenase
MRHKRPFSGRVRQRHGEEIIMSTAFKAFNVNDPEADIIRRFGVEGGHLGPGEIDSPWVPYGDNAAIRHMAFDVRGNWYANTLWIKKPGMIGTHKHHGTVLMLCTHGSVRYLEYDWTATAGSFISETPGQAHTLVTEHPEGVKLFGWMQGVADHYDDQGNIAESIDVFWFVNHYVSYCEANNIPINKALFL